MTAVDPNYMKNKRKIIFQSLLISLFLGGCSTTDNQQTAVNSPMVEVEQQINALMKEIGKVSVQQHSLSQISHCRYEIASSWSDYSRGFFAAQNKQRFSFAHDLRNIDHTPAHQILFKSGVQRWNEKLQLMFNRMVPNTFNYVQTKDFKDKTDNTQSDSFSIGGFGMVSDDIMLQLKAALERLAQLCNANMDRFDTIEQKLLGRWEIYGISETEGGLIIDENEVGLILDGQPLIQGGYVIEPVGQYYRMTVTPNNGEAEIYLMFDFVNSNYARLLLMGNEPQTTNFAPYWAQNAEQAYNDNEKKLFREGDLR